MVRLDSLRLNINDEYKLSMGVFNVADQLWNQYRFDHWLRKFKWWWTISLWGIHVLMTNGYFFYAAYMARGVVFSCCSAAACCHHWSRNFPPPLYTVSFAHNSNIGRRFTHFTTVACLLLVYYQIGLIPFVWSECRELIYVSVYDIKPFYFLTMITESP